MSDDGNVIRGVLIGLAICIPFWILLGWLVWRFA